MASLAGKDTEAIRHEVDVEGGYHNEEKRRERAE